jgi:hypothetical protein
MGRLNALQVKNLHAYGFYADGGGLYLQVDRRHSANHGEASDTGLAAELIRRSMMVPHPAFANIHGWQATIADEHTKTPGVPEIVIALPNQEMTRLPSAKPSNYTLLTSACAAIPAGRGHCP